MSALPGEITKQILSAPPSTSRSTRYSLTARGRSRSPSRRLPTGSSSFEKASGCIRLPCPAAGTIPPMKPFRRYESFQLAGTRVGRVLRQRAAPRRVGDGAPIALRHVQRLQDIVRIRDDDQFPSRLEERVEPFPPIADDRRPARG